MKINTKVFLLGLLSTVLIHHSAHADLGEEVKDMLGVLCDDSKPVTKETEEKILAEMDAKEGKNWWQKLRHRVTQQLKGTELKYSINLPTMHLGDVDFDFGVSRSSDLGQGGKYSQADRWNLAVGYDTGLIKTLAPRFGLSESITFIRQFETRRESICKSLPSYDPRDKVPQSAVDFDETNKNALKVNEFIEFQTQLSLGLPEWIKGRLAIMGPASVSGRFTVQIYRMTEDLVRVRVSSIHDRNLKFGLQYSLFNVNLPGALDRYNKIKFTIMERNKADLLVFDTVFNFNKELNARKKTEGKPTAAELYDQYISSHVQVEKNGMFDAIKQLVVDNIKKNNLVSDNHRQAIFADFDNLANISVEDDKEYVRSGVPEKRIYLLNKGGLEGVTHMQGLELNLFRIVGLKIEQSDYESLLTMHDKKNIPTKYVLQGTGKLSSWHALKTFGQLIGGSTNLVLTAPLDAKVREELIPASKDYQSGEAGTGHGAYVIKHELPVTSVFGMNISREIDERSLDEKEAKRLTQKLKDQLTIDVFNMLNWGQHLKSGEEVEKYWKTFEENRQSNVRIRQSIMFKESMFKRFETDIHINAEMIQERIEQILIKKQSAREKMKALPDALKDIANLHGGGDGGNTSSWHSSLVGHMQRKEYVKAFASDTNTISNRLANLLNSKDTNYRYQQYKSLTQNQLFMEIGGIIVMYIYQDPENEKYLKEDVVIRVSVSATGRQPVIGYYPSKDAYDGLRTFTSILDYQSYLSDRSYNLKNYIREDGNAYTLGELLADPTAGQNMLAN